ncbi:hypothetical protein D5S17_32750 [Pseudonocardiaceae bacterium YIM PH 21723]|nr:hypothetical protein D5S17_32750 [Pseudonocardiaceae bacterium YIM PH 21723]
MPLSLPSPATAITGQDVTAAFWNAQVRDAITFLLNPPIFNGTANSVQTIANNTVTALALNVNVIDSYAGHSTSTNNTKYFAQVAGWYLCTGTVSFSPNGTGDRSVRLVKNGTSVTGSGAFIPPTTGGSNTTLTTPAMEVFLNVGDFIEVHGYQSCGGPLNTNSDPTHCCSLNLIWKHA